MAETNKPVDRETLYREVWTDPVAVVAPRYGLSNVGLAKICRALAIPLPSSGYWAKVKVGRIMKRVPLPELKPSVALPNGPVRLTPEMAAVREAVAARDAYTAGQPVSRYAPGSPIADDYYDALRPALSLPARERETGAPVPVSA